MYAVEKPFRVCGRDCPGMQSVDAYAHVRYATTGGMS